MADTPVTPTPDADPVDEPLSPQRVLGARLLGIAALAIAAVIVVLCLTRWNAWLGAARHQRTDDAYLEADLTPIGARVAGYVRAVPTQDFERVRAGQLIAQIDDDDYQAAVDQARAAVDVARTAIGNIDAQTLLQQANVTAARAGIAQAQAVAQRAGRTARRSATLEAGGAGTRDAVEAGEAGALVAQADLQKATALHAAALRQLGVLASQRRQAEAQLRAAQAAASLALINLGRTRILAPQDGVLGQRQVRPGQYLAVGGQVTTLTPLPHTWVIANYKETQLTRMRVGQPVAITVDAYSGVVMRGHVAAFAPASGAKFSLLPPDNATGNFTKIVQRVAVKIAIDDAGGLADRLRPGLSVVTDVDTGAR
ncbi:MAG: HlyD family secretion protein [Sphingomonadales bacterium]|nr:HlyD family secretion protein [Sphingomonadales bacterium]MDE2171033.1 HlyD family secretion protein [Sphingomonadales bacterium]